MERRCERLLGGTGWKRIIVTGLEKECCDVRHSASLWIAGGRRISSVSGLVFCRLFPIRRARRGSQSPFLRVIPLMFASGPPRICELDRETVLVELGRVHCDQASEALARGVDQIQITVGAVVPTQTNVGARALTVRGVHLEQRRECQESGKRIVRLETAEQDGEISGARREGISCRISRCPQLEAIPLLGKVEGQSFADSIGCAHPGLIQMPVVVAAEALVEVECQPPILR